jgi:hypothetical protein
MIYLRSLAGMPQYNQTAQDVADYGAGLLSIHTCMVAAEDFNVECEIEPDDDYPSVWFNVSGEPDDIIPYMEKLVELDKAQYFSVDASEDGDDTRIDSLVTRGFAKG